MGTKGTVSVILSEPPCKDDNTRFTSLQRNHWNLNLIKLWKIQSFFWLRSLLPLNNNVQVNFEKILQTKTNNFKKQKHKYIIHTWQTKLKVDCKSDIAIFAWSNKSTLTFLIENGCTQLEQKYSYKKTFSLVVFIVHLAGILHILLTSCTLFHRFYQIKSVDLIIFDFWNQVLLNLNHVDLKLFNCTLFHRFYQIKSVDLIIFDFWNQVLLNLNHVDLKLFT